MNSYFEHFLITGTAWTTLVILKFAIPKNRKSPDWSYAMGVLIIFLITILDNLLRPQFIPMRILNYIYPITRLSYFLVGPALFLYTSKLLQDNFVLKPKMLLHLIPFGIFLIYVIIDPESLHPRTPFAVEGEIVQKTIQEPLINIYFALTLTKNLSRLLYSTLILWIIRKNEKALPDHVSYINRKNTLSWLKVLLIFYTGIYLFDSIVHIFVPDEIFFSQISAAVGRNIPPLLFVVLFSLLSDSQPILAYTEEHSKEDSTKYKKSGTSEVESKRIYKKLTEYLKISKAYLEPELTLQTLAEELDESRQRLSEVINREAKKRFYTFINDYRLKEFEDAIKENRYPDYTLISIAYECGFKSSSGFYSVIKKEHGITPKALVKKLTAEVSEAV